MLDKRRYDHTIYISTATSTRGAHMAEKVSYPQIPSNVWWGIRNLLQKSPNAKYDAGMIGASLGVQEAAAKQYVAELKKIGVLDEDGKATPAALRWRQDEEYVSAVEEIAREAYPEALLTIAPPGDADRDTVVNWFIGQNLGTGSAKNKAATYLLVTSAEPAEEAMRAKSTTKSRKSTEPSTAKKSTAASAGQTKSEVSLKKSNKPVGATTGGFPLNVNVQIHISADASTDQIDSIFSAMRKYLHDD